MGWREEIRNVFQMVDDEEGPPDEVDEIARKMIELLNLASDKNVEIQAKLPGIGRFYPINMNMLFFKFSPKAEVPQEPKKK